MEASFRKHVSRLTFYDSIKSWTGECVRACTAGLVAAGHLSSGV